MTPITDSCAAGTYCPIVKRILQTLNKRITNAPRVAFYPPSRPVRGMIEVSSFCCNYDWSWGLIGGDLQQTRSKLEIDVLDVDTFAWDDDGHGCAKSGLAWSILLSTWHLPYWLSFPNLQISRGSSSQSLIYSNNEMDVKGVETSKIY